MRSTVLIIGLVLLLLLSAASVFAQEATPETDASRLRGTIWLRTDPERPDDEPAPVLFITIDEDGTLIEVEDGLDVLYTPIDETSYSGAMLIPTDLFTFEAALTLMDEERREVVSTTTTSFSHSTRTLIYLRGEQEFEVWSEVERTVIEYSLFQECMGVSNLRLGSTWTATDPLLPLRLDEESGSLVIGRRTFAGADGSFERVQEAPFGQFTQVITETATLSDAELLLRYHAITDERDDCEMIYEARYAPFDGDYAALFAAIEARAEE